MTTTHFAKSLWYRVIIAASVAVVALLVVLPAVHFAQLTVFKKPPSYPTVVPQISVGGSAPPQDVMSRLRSVPYDPHYPPIVITYHNIDVQGSVYTVTPQAFATQMRLLHDAGWRTLTAAQFVAWRHGSPIPPHSVLLTFDDGPLGVFRYADPVLRRYNMHALAFIITGWVGKYQPYYMTWRELELLHGDHHWDLEAHTYLGHGKVVTNATGTKEPFLVTTMWLPRQHRVETLAEYETRVRSDLRRCIADLVGHGIPRPRLFAYPFSAVGGNAEGAALRSVVGSMFDAAFLDSNTGEPNGPKEELSRLFHRVDVTRPESLTQYVQNIQTTANQPVYSVSSWRNHSWESTAGTSIKLPAKGPVPLSVALMGDPYAEMHLDPNHTSFWTNYEVRATISELKGQGGASLDTLLGSSDEIKVAVRSFGYKVYKGVGVSARLLHSGRLAATGPKHQVQMMVRPGSVIVRIDGELLTTVSTNMASTGGITIGGDPYHAPPVLTSVWVTPLPPA